MKILKLLSLIMVLASLASAGPKDGGFLKAKGKNIVDEKGRVVLLRGVGLANWMLPEGYMMKLSGSGDRPRGIEAGIEKALGPQEAAAFWKKWRANYITEADIRRIAELGYNSVRPALKARDFLTEEENPRYLKEGFELLDQLIGWCAKYDLYVIVDLHAAPGGQTGKNIDDSAFNFPHLFDKQQYEDQTIDLWRQLAKRYKNNPTVAAYDLLNEPLPDEFRQFFPRLEVVYKNITKAIREIDKRHIIMLEGASWANNWTVFGKPFDDNLVYQFHKYWSDPDRASVQEYIDFQERHQIPVWIGEFGESTMGPHWNATTTQLFEDLGFGWSFWPWKKLGERSTIYKITVPKDWDKIQGIYTGGPTPSREDARRILNELLKNIKLKNAEHIPEMHAFLLRLVPARIFATDFTHKGEGISYHVNNPSRRAPIYRRGDPVDIQPSLGGIGYQVGFIEAGEWLEYDLQVEADGIYDFGVRAATEASDRSFRISANGKDLGIDFKVGRTGGWKKFVVFETKGVALKKGPVKLRVNFPMNEINLDYFYFTRPGQPVPERKENLTMLSGGRGLLPGKVQFEDFGPKGALKSYNDTTAGNRSNGLRPKEDVDIESFVEPVGYNLGWVEAGEWLSYPVIVDQDGDYELQFKLAAESKGHTFHVKLNGQPVTGEVQIPSTGAWYNWALVKTKIKLKKGPANLQVHFTTGGCNFDWFSAALAGAPPVTTATGPKAAPGDPVRLPGLVEAENFGIEGEGKSYHDKNAENNGGEYRNNAGVDIQAIEGDTLPLVNLETGEWLVYEFSSTKPQELRLFLKARSNDASELSIKLDGSEIARTNVKGAWAEVELGKVKLSSGLHSLKVEATRGTSSIDYYEFRP